MTVPEVAKRIDDLLGVIQHTCTNSEEIADKINSILIHGEGVPPNILKAGWDFFAKQRGI